MTDLPEPGDRARALALLEAAEFMRDAHFRDGLTVQEITTALAHTVDRADAMVGSLARDGFGAVEIAEMLSADAPAVSSAVVAPPTDQAAHRDRRERYANAIHDAMETDLSLVDQEPAYQALIARAAEAAEALADAEQNRQFLTTLANLGIAAHRLDRIRDAARLHRQQLLGTSELYAVIEADDAQPEPGARHVHITIHHPDPTTATTAAHAIADLIRGEYGDSLRLTITTDAQDTGTPATTTVAPSPARSNATPQDVATPPRLADETPDTETEAHAPLNEWRVEILDGDEWMPASGLRRDRSQAAEQLRLASERRPLWADGTRVQRRLVRETTTYTVEPEPAAGARQDGPVVTVHTAPDLSPAAEDALGALIDVAKQQATEGWRGATEVISDAEVQRLAATGLVGYRQGRGQLLHCLHHKPVPASRWADFHEVTSEDLPDGGICVHPRCGADLLAVQPAAREDGGAQ